MKAPASLLARCFCRICFHWKTRVRPRRSEADSRLYSWLSQIIPHSIHILCYHLPMIENNTNELKNIPDPFAYIRTVSAIVIFCTHANIFSGMHGFQFYLIHSMVLLHLSELIAKLSGTAYHICLLLTGFIITTILSVLFRRATVF